MNSPSDSTAAPNTARAPPPTEPLPTSVLAPFMRFLALKQLKRQGWLDAGVPPAQCESVAGHSFGCALLAALTADELGVDPLRVITMLLIHDLAEVEVGDLTPRDGVTRAEKYALEQRALRTLLAPLPTALSDRLLGLWEEFEAGATRAARCAREIDVVERTLQAAYYERSTAAPALEQFWAGVENMVQTPLYRTLLRHVRQGATEE